MTKRGVFSLALKILTVLALMSNVSTFQSFGAAQVNEQSPSVALKCGLQSKSLLLEFLRLAVIID